MLQLKPFAGGWLPGMTSRVVGGHFLLSGVIPEEVVSTPSMSMALHFGVVRRLYWRVFSPGRLTVVGPYEPFAMQDRNFGRRDGLFGGPLAFIRKSPQGA